MRGEKMKSYIRQKSEKKETRCTEKFLNIAGIKLKYMNNNLNVNGLTTLIKKIENVRINKIKSQLYAVYSKSTLNIKIHTGWFRIKGRRSIYDAKLIKRKLG